MLEIIATIGLVAAILFVAYIIFSPSVKRGD